MRYPYRLVGNSWLPRKFGFAAQTVFCWILLPGATITYSVLTHEKEHVKDFWWWWGIGVVLCFLLGLSWYWFLLTPFTYSFAYAVMGCYAMSKGKRWYHDNYFERKARAVAGEPV